MKIVFVALVIAVVAIVLLFVLCVETIPPDALTRTNMIVLEKRIRVYADVHKRLPDSLSELPKPTDNRGDCLLDGWGRPIQYIKEGKTLTLLSSGKDGRPGENDQAD